MRGISSVNNNYASTLSYNHYTRSLASGKKINTAADGAAELAILQKQIKQSNGYNVGTQNLKEGKSALNIADGAMSGVTDSLQRIRELAVKASNGLNTDTDKQYIQTEIDQLKQGIDDIASRTNYNENNLLDGSMTDKVIISDSDGHGTPISSPSLSLESLGIKDFDVTGSFDLSAIDKAIEKVNGGRSSVGAQTNMMDYAINYNNNVDYNTVASQSRIGDTEYGDYVSKLQQERTLRTYQIMMQKQRIEQHRQNVLGLFQ